MNSGFQDENNFEITVDGRTMKKEIARVRENENMKITVMRHDAATVSNSGSKQVKITVSRI